MEGFVNNLVIESSINTTNEKINCLHPVIITNPQLKDLLYKYQNFTADGHTHYLGSSASRCMPHFFPKSYFHPSPDIKLEDLDRYFVTDFSTGEVFPMYLAVPCGKCDICIGSKVDAFAHRCELESQCYSSLPYFITLTYNNSHLPKDGLSIRDTQIFFKRLRSRLVYAGCSDKFRYVCAGQYGSKGTHRAHYHLIIWNLHPFKDMKFYKLKRLIRHSWNKGHIYLSIVSPNYIVKGTNHCLSKPEKCFEYVGRYLCHGGDVPAGKNPMFINTSRLHGGIGAPFLDRHAAYIRKYNISDFKYLDKFSNSLKSVVYCRYNLNRLFPTVCQSVPLELRNAVRHLCYTAPILKRSDGYIDTCKRAFPKLFWPSLFPEDIGSPHNDILKSLECPLLKHVVHQSVWEDILILNKYKDFDFDKSDSLARSRLLVLDKLFRHKPVAFLLPIANRRRRNFVLARQREIF